MAADDDRIRVLEASLAERDAEIARLAALLEANQLRLERLFQANPVPLFVLSRGGTVLNANRRALATLGLARSRVVGQPFDAWVDPAWQARTGEHLELAQEHGTHAGEAGLLTRDGKTLLARLETTSVEDEAGAVLLVAVLVLTESAENLRLVGDTYDAAMDRVRTFSDAYGR